MDLIAENHEKSGIDLSELPTVKSRRGEEKIAYVPRILPDRLKQGGHDPLDLLYGLFSAGLHGNTDEECVENFDKAVYVFEYFFRNLGQANEEAKTYSERLGSLARSSKEAE